MLNAKGCNTATAAARIVSQGELASKKVAVLAGAGPVGLRPAATLAQDGTQVAISSRSLDRAESVQERFGLEVAAGAIPSTGSRESMANAAASGYTTEPVTAPKLEPPDSGPDTASGRGQD